MRHTRVGLFTISTLMLVLFFSEQGRAQQLERGPYLQQVTPSSVTVRWRTDIATDAVVRFGTDVTLLDRVEVGSSSDTEHEVVVTGLTPGERYYYSVGDATGALAGGDASFTFRASPSTGTQQSIRVWVIGDSGTADSNARRVRDAYLGYSANRSADLWLMLGDNAYENGTDAEYQSAVFDTYPTILRNTPLWTTLGNHDGHSADSNTEQGPYYDIFTLPKNAEAGGVASGTEAYYSFDYGNIHFITLDSYDTDRSTGGAMLTWLENDLASTAQEWLIAYWHHPPYTKGSHNSDTEIELIDMRERALPILESYGVDLVLSGHSHSYERSFLIDGHYGKSNTFSSSMLIDDGSGRINGDGAYAKTAGANPNQGAVYAVAGSSGKTSSGSLDHPVMYLSVQILGSMILDVDGDRLDAAFIDDGGIRQDYFTIQKGTGGGDTEQPTPVSNLTASGITSSSVTLGWSPASDNVAVTGYRVTRNGTVVTTTTTLAYVDTGLAPNTTYNYSVVAFDAAGNESTPTSVSATTLSGNTVGNNSDSGGGSIGMISMLVSMALIVLFRGRDPRTAIRTLSIVLLLGMPLLATSHEDLDLQIADVKQKIDRAPDDYRLRAKLGELHGMHADWPLAVISFQQAQSLAPVTAAADLDLRTGEALHRAGRPDQGLPHVERYLDAHPNSSEGWRIHADILGSLGETDAALASFDRSIRMAKVPTPELYFERARLLEGQPNRIGELLAGIDDGIARLGPLSSLVEYAINKELQRENYSAAVARMDELPEIMRQQPRWLYWRSTTLLKLGRATEAMQFNRMALQAISDLPERRKGARAYAALLSKIESSYAEMTVSHKAD
jgi:chitodextrinase/tetratricopeptide (TPR) repeat protein